MHPLKQKQQILRRERFNGGGRDIEARRRFNVQLKMIRGGGGTKRSIDEAGGGEAGDSKRTKIKVEHKFETFKGHSNRVYSVSFSPDGAFIASGSKDKTVKVWSVESGECVMTLEDDHYRILVMSVSFSPDGQWIASAWNNTVKVWSVESGECVRTLEGHSSDVYSVSFSPDGQWIASGSGDTTVKVWSVESGECVTTLEGNSYWVTSVSFSPDGQSIAYDSDNTVKVWSVASGEWGLEKTLEGHSNVVTSVSFSPDGQWIASGSRDETVKVWSVESGECVRTLEGHSNWVSSVSFSPDGQCIASGSLDKTVKVWSVESGECVTTLEDHSNWVMSVSFSPDGQWIASGSEDDTVTVWSVPLLKYSPLGETIYSLFYELLITKVYEHRYGKEVRPAPVFEEDQLKPYSTTEYKKYTKGDVDYETISDILVSNFKIISVEYEKDKNEYKINFFINAFYEEVEHREVYMPVEVSLTMNGEGIIKSVSSDIKVENEDELKKLMNKIGYDQYIQYIPIWEKLNNLKKTIEDTSSTNTFDQYIQTLENNKILRMEEYSEE